MNRTIRWVWRLNLVVGVPLLAFVVAAHPALAAAAATSPYRSGTTGYDVSWPNCSAKAPAHAAFGIVGGA